LKIDFHRCLDRPNRSLSTKQPPSGPAWLRNTLRRFTY
jgi:hypothetical protein